MNKILLEGEELDLSEVKFPVLIHGVKKSGASLYTISLAANLFTKGNHIIFLCGYPMAEEEFNKQIPGTNTSQISFFTKVKTQEFKEALSEMNEDLIIFIKNIELFGQDVLDLILHKEKVVISGDINKYEFINELFQKHFSTKIVFSEMAEMEIPDLGQYEGYFQTDSLVGKTIIKTVDYRNN